MKIKDQKFGGLNANCVHYTLFMVLCFCHLGDLRQQSFYLHIYKFSRRGVKNGIIGMSAFHCIVLYKTFFDQRTGLKDVSFIIFKPFCCSAPALLNIKFAEKSQNTNMLIFGHQIVQTTQKLASKHVSWIYNIVYLQIYLFKISSPKK